MEETVCIVTFPTTAGAMAMEKACRAEARPGRLIPVPRSVTAGCGMCWMAPRNSREVLEELVIRRKIQIDGIYDMAMPR